MRKMLVVKDGLLTSEHRQTLAVIAIPSTGDRQSVARESVLEDVAAKDGRPVLVTNPTTSNRDNL